MSKHVVIAHCWDGAPDYIWYPWLKQKLESQGHRVSVPALPNTEEPRIQAWVPALGDAIGTADAPLILVGHSMGCQAIARYLVSQPESLKIAGAVFVAGFFTRLSGLEDDEVVRDVSKEWLETPLDLGAVRNHIEKSVAIFSDNDPYVPLDNQDAFRDQLGSEILIQSQMGHFSGETKELPVVLESILSL